MRKSIRVLCATLAILFLCNIPVSAVEHQTRGSDFFAVHALFISWKSGTQFEIWFDVTGTDTMNRIGVSEIKLQRSTTSTGGWTTIKTYLPNAYPQMLAYNTFCHASYVPYSGAARGYFYRAVITFYAANANGVGEYIDYTTAVYIPHSTGGGSRIS